MAEGADNGVAILPHPERIAETNWRDPDDTTALERDSQGRAHQRTISGCRAIDPLTRLPCEPDHHRAASRRRPDWECGSGAPGGGATALCRRTLRIASRGYLT
jgi:hypothetical protein